MQLSEIQGRGDEGGGRGVILYQGHYNSSG